MEPATSRLTLFSDVIPLRSAQKGPNKNILYASLVYIFHKMDWEYFNETLHEGYLTYD